MISVVAGAPAVGGVVVAVGFLAWVGLWLFGGVVDLSLAAWWRRTPRESSAVGRLETRDSAASPTSLPSRAPEEEDESYELSEANVAPDWTEGLSWLEWEAPRDFVAGESHYIDALRELTGPPRSQGYLLPVDVRFVRERTNPYDGNAWRAEVDGRKVGYARRHIAAQFSLGLDPMGISEFTVCGVMRGGSTEAPNVGVHVWPERRPEPGPEVRLRDEALAVAWPPTGSVSAAMHRGSPSDRASGHPRAAAELFDEYLREADKTIEGGHREDVALDYVKMAADIAIANESPEQKAAAAAMAERLMKFAQGTETLARAARIKKRLETKPRARKQDAASVEERLATLADLCDRGVITEDEYAAQRAAVIKQL
jgi:hypothetical protein